MSMDAALARLARELPNWFLYEAKDDRTEIRFLGEKHEHKGWIVGLQHINGGRLHRSMSNSLAEALEDTINMVLANEHNKGLL